MLTTRLGLVVALGLLFVLPTSASADGDVFADLTLDAALAKAGETDKMVVVGKGGVDLETEKLNVTWASKPRRGVGLSASAVTNSYIKLGGTMSKPRITIKPLKAVAATGATIATGGLSLLVRGLFDRATAEKKVCDRALKKVEKRAQKGR